MQLGVCYYPEHWPEDRWAGDAARMAALGIARVRIGEFAWSRIEPEPGVFDWGWLDRAIETLGKAGLGVILGTPTATPPRWLVDSMPDMIALDAQGRERRFGSRRHYCFSHEPYKAEGARITQALAERYGEHPAIVAWQTDNEYGCHDTIISYSDAARDAFRLWLEEKHGSVDALNAAWGTVFWSQEYSRFDQVELPNLTVTEPNPAHVMDFRRFASDQVVRFNRLQVDILRAGSPGRDIMHNFMGFFPDFDHHDVGADCDVAGWDSYPLGFLERSHYPEAEKIRLARHSHPDIAAFHHDLYRGCCNGRWWVIEQQPGPVNWAAWNPAPADGMVQLWTLEAAAHGAELLAYFRWRQAPFAQEQMHAGLLKPDGSDAPAIAEMERALGDLQALGSDTAQALAADRAQTVALVFSYPAQWLFHTQPQGRDFDYFELAMAFYTALRRLGLNVDIVSPDAALSGYAAVVAPSLPFADAAIAERLAALDCPVLIGPRSGSRTADCRIPDDLPPGALHALLPLRVARVESLRPGLEMAGEQGEGMRWIEHIETDLPVEFASGDGMPFVFRKGSARYCATWPDEQLFETALTALTDDAGLTLRQLPRDVRTRASGGYRFYFNHGPDAASVSDVAGDGEWLIGGPDLPSASYAVQREE